MTILEELRKRGYHVTGSDIQKLDQDAYVSMDITDREVVMRTVADLKPDVIIHCAAWTAVDAAEAEENREKVHAINADGTIRECGL